MTNSLETLPRCQALFSGLDTSTQEIPMGLGNILTTIFQIEGGAGDDNSIKATW